MVPYQYLYLDYSQTRDQAVYGEPLAIDSGLTLEKCYSFDPFAGLNEEERAHIKGVQANLWTEYIADFGHVQHMLLPRLSAAAEPGAAKRPTSTRCAAAFATSCCRSTRHAVTATPPTNSGSWTKRPEKRWKHAENS